MPKEPTHPVVAPQGAVLLRQLLAAVSVPERLVEEAKDRGSNPVEDDRPRVVEDLRPRPDRPEVQVDVLGRDEAGVESAESAEELGTVPEVARRVAHVIPVLIEFDPIELPEGRGAHRDGPAGHHGRPGEPLSDPGQPRRVGDAVPIDEGKAVAPSPRRGRVTALPPGPGALPGPEGLWIALGKLAGDLEGAVPTQGIDDQHFERRFLRDQTLKEATQVGSLVPNGDDHRDEGGGRVTFQVPSRQHP